MARSALAPIELRVVRGAEISSSERVERSASLIFPLGSTVVTVVIGDDPVERIDRASFALVPAASRHRVRAQSPVGEIATLLVTSATRAQVVREYAGHVDAKRFVDLIASSRILPRTRWVDELVHRYVFERDVCGKHGSAAAMFLSTELAKELYFLCAERDEARTRRSVLVEEKDALRRARELIERDLATTPSVSALARHAHTSESTLLRAFQRELGTTPAAFARDRKLDASLLLLQSKRYTIGEVASQVGYGNLSSFTTAFHRRFGATPSSVVQSNAALEVLPPHGKPPRRKRRRV